MVFLINQQIHYKQKPEIVMKSWDMLYRLVISTWHEKWLKLSSLSGSFVENLFKKQKQGGGDDMRTKLISSSCSNHPGYGAGMGDTEWYEYECPCGDGTIIEEHDNIPGFREHSVYIHCSKCEKKYRLDISNGTRYWELVEIVDK